jgi:predicted site-specific integrase-resolvase
VGKWRDLSMLASRGERLLQTWWEAFLFGYGYFEAFCERHNTALVVIDGETLSPEQELVQDLVAILTVFSARLHGLRAYKKAIRDAALQKNQAPRD